MANIDNQNQAPSSPTDPSAAPPLLKLLMKGPTRFHFYQVVRLLERLGGGAPIGQVELPRRESIRLRALDSLSFPACDVTEVTPETNPWDDSATRYLVTVTFLGLYGPASPLPTAYTDLIIRPQGDEDPEDRQRLRAFLDIFHHRYLSLFYRTLSKYRYHFIYEPGAQDVFSQYMLSLIGRGTPGQQKERPIPAERMIRYAGLLTQSPKNAASLEGLLRDFLGVAVRVQQCMGRWLRVEDRNVLGGRFCALGEDMIVGASVYDRAGKFRISVGPVGLEDFKEFLPTGRRMGQLRELARLYLQDELEFDTEVWLNGDEVPPLQMGAAPGAAMLGWTSWSVTGPGPDRAVVFRS